LYGYRNTDTTRTAPMNARIAVRMFGQPADHILDALAKSWRQFFESAKAR
jgi:hypothetical protein